MTVGILHPGQMGAAIAAQLKGRVIWASDGRSNATRSRATEAGLTDVGDLGSLVDQSQVILSICPPHAAFDLAHEVAKCRVRRSPMSMPTPSRRQQSTKSMACSTNLVDGGIVGGPPAGATGPRLYLSGRPAAEVAQLFSSTLVTPVILGVRARVGLCLQDGLRGMDQGLGGFADRGSGIRPITRFAR